MAFYYETSYQLTFLTELVKYIAQTTFELDINQTHKKIVDEIYDLSIGFERDCLKEDPNHKIVLSKQEKSHVLKKLEHFLITDRKEIIKFLINIRKTIKNMERSAIEATVIV